MLTRAGPRRPGLEPLLPPDAPAVAAGSSAATCTTVKETTKHGPLVFYWFATGSAPTEAAASVLPEATATVPVLVRLDPDGSAR